MLGENVVRRSWNCEGKRHPSVAVRRLKIIANPARRLGLLRSRQVMVTRFFYVSNTFLQTIQSTLIRLLTDLPCRPHKTAGKRLGVSKTRFVLLFYALSSTSNITVDGELCFWLTKTWNSNLETRARLSCSHRLFSLDNHDTLQRQFTTPQTSEREGSTHTHPGRLVFPGGRQLKGAFCASYLVKS